jgi:hypothetical protein
VQKVVKPQSLLAHTLKGWLMLLLLSLFFAIGANYFAERSLVRHIKQSLINQAILFEGQIGERLQRERGWMELLASEQGSGRRLSALLQAYQQGGHSSAGYQSAAHICGLPFRQDRAV